MTVNNSYPVGPYNVANALNLLGPADFDRSAPIRCYDYLLLAISHIAIVILRIINFICGDHQWYNNETAHRILEQYLQGSERNHDLNLRMRELYSALQLRENHQASYAEGINFDQILNFRLEPIQENREQAHEILREAEVRADQIYDPTDKSSAFYKLAKRLIPLHPEQANEILQPFQNAVMSIPLGESYLHQSLSKVRFLCRLALLKHPLEYRGVLRQAQTVMSQIEDLDSKSIAQRYIIKLLASADAVHAAAKALRIQKPNHKALAICDIAQIQTRTDPSAANHTFAEAVECANTIDNDQTKVNTLLEIAKKRYLTNQEAANEIVLQTANILDGLQTNHEWIAHTHIKMARLQMTYDRDRANANLNQALIHANRIPNNHYRKAIILVKLANVEAQKNQGFADQIIREALDVANQLESPWNFNTLIHIADMISEIRPELAAEILQNVLTPSLPAHLKGSGYYTLVKMQAQTNVVQALATARQIADKYWKVKALYKIASTRLPPRGALYDSQQ